MGDKGVENNIQKWNEKRQKFIAELIGNDIQQGSVEENAIESVISTGRSVIDLFT